MSKYKGKPAAVEQPVGTLFERLGNLDNLSRAIENIPEDKRSQIGEIAIADGLLSIATPVGNVTFGVVETVVPTKIVYGATSSPVPLRIEVNLTGQSADTTLVEPEIEIDLPPMLRMMVGSKLQDAADKFGELIVAFCR